MPKTLDLLIYLKHSQYQVGKLHLMNLTLFVLYEYKSSAVWLIRGGQK